MTKLERLRRQNKLSKSELARISKVSADTILKIETEQRAENVRVCTYTNLAKALGVHTLDLIDDDLIV